MRLSVLRIVSVVLISLSVLALSDIIGGEEPSNTAEYAGLCVALLWFLALAGLWLGRR